MAATLAEIVNAHGETWLRIDRPREDAFQPRRLPPYDRGETVLLNMGAIVSVSYEKRDVVGVFEIVLTIYLSDQGKWKFAGDEARAVACALGIEIGEPWSTVSAHRGGK